MSVLTTKSVLFGRRFCLRWRFTHHRMAFGPLHHRSHRPTWRFSAWLGPASRCAKLRKNPSHRSPYLARGRRPCPRLPRTAFTFHPWPRQHQLVMHHRDQIGPAFHLLRRPHPRRRLQQILLVEAIPMFLAKPPRIQVQPVRPVAAVARPATRTTLRAGRAWCVAHHCG